jgi:hypothetical protein
VQANHTITASFSPNGPYTIRSSAGSGGSITPNGSTAVACGGSQDYSIAAEHCLLDRGRRGGRRVAGPGRELHVHQRAVEPHDHGSVQRQRPVHDPVVGGPGGSITPTGRRAWRAAAARTTRFRRTPAISIADVRWTACRRAGVALHVHQRAGEPHDQRVVQRQRPVHDRRRRGPGGSITPTGRRAWRAAAARTTRSRRTLLTRSPTSWWTACRRARSRATRSPTCRRTTRSRRRSAPNGPYTIEASPARAGRSRRRATRWWRGGRRTTRSRPNTCFSIADV